MEILARITRSYILLTLACALAGSANAQFVQQGGNLVAAANGAGQGYSVALSADGNTAIVGAPPNDNGGLYAPTGGAWVYTRSGGVWTQQGGELAGTGAVGSADQGWSVALSADGNTAIVGGPSDSHDAGAAWVFTRSGGVWTQQGSKLVGIGSVGPYVYQGWSVALSADGNTAIVGGFGDSPNYQGVGIGAAWVFTRSGGVWTQQGSKLVGTGAVGSACQGLSVALSADGNTAIVGGDEDNNQAGAAWVFTRSGGVWTQQGSKLVGTGSVQGQYGAGQGYSVALSADGNTAIVGGAFDNAGAGAAWVFTRSGGVWTQQGSKLVGTGSVGNAGQGRSVSLSADGNTAIVGALGDNAGAEAAWVFTRSGGVWTQQGSKLVGTGSVQGQYGAGQGCSVALSADGNTAIVGGYGAAWVFVAQPTMTVAPTSMQFSWQAGGANPSPATVSVSGGGQSLSFTAQVTSGSNWLSVSPTSGTTPTAGSAALTVTATPGNLGAGSYNGTILVSGTGTATGSTSVTVTLTVTAPLPTIKGVTNAASYSTGAVSPGELVTIFGTAIGPATPAYATTDPSTGKLATTIGGVQVLFNGVAAPMIYASSTQVSAVVPYEMAGIATPPLWIRYAGQTSNAFQVTSTTTAPGLFTQNASGSGPGAILNQDNSVNGPGNGAARGSIVQVYLTGEGQTSPQGVTGAITKATLPPPQVTPAPLLPVGVLINGLPALYVYAGEAPGLVAGMMQLNVQIPANALSGNLPITVSIGANTSQNGVTVSVQ
jgi:uncharacterized protein (TIGR03437 family)